MPSLNTLKDLLIDELKDLYSAETQLVKALPKMAEAASNEELQAGIEEHLEQTKGHVERLDRALKILEATPKGKTCKAMKGLIEEGAEAIDSEAPDPIRDANLIGAAQRVEHYEIAAYGTARAFADTLEEEEISSLLQETLDEEEETDKKLTELSEAINEEAKAAGGEEEEESVRSSDE
ncbi:MAG TPA: ferritin-like domain-containing protein [Opitutaceae bacterium]|nr:ferritin-like domain-containing protein [Opitutaceae bacterium]